jgi:hypothetical protein
VPGHGRVDVSPDGIEFRDRDLMLVPRLTLRFTSNAAFGVTGVEERRTAGGFLFAVSPMVIRPLDSAE